jgi:hypothetical protein
MTRLRGEEFNHLNPPTHTFANKKPLIPPIDAVALSREGRDARTTELPPPLGLLRTAQEDADAPLALAADAVLFGRRPSCWTE